MQENYIDSSSLKAKVEIVKNILDNKSMLREFNRNDLVSSEEDKILLKKLEETDGLTVDGYTYHDEKHKQGRIDLCKILIQETEERNKIVKEKSPQQRIQESRQTFLDQLDNKNLKGFSSRNFSFSQNTGVDASMSVDGKNSFKYAVRDVFNFDEEGNLMEIKGKEFDSLYEEKITLSEKQLKNLLSIIEENIEKIGGYIKEETDQANIIGWYGRRDRLEETAEILKNGFIKIKKEDYYQPDINLSA